LIRINFTLSYLTRWEPTVLTALILLPAKAEGPQPDHNVHDGAPI